MSVRIYIEDNTPSWVDQTNRFDMRRPGKVEFGVDFATGVFKLSPPKQMVIRNLDGWWTTEPSRSGGSYEGAWEGRRVKITLEQGTGVDEEIIGTFRVRAEEGIVLNHDGTAKLYLEGLEEELRRADAADFSHGRGWYPEMPWPSALNGVRKPEDDSTLTLPSAMIEYQGGDRHCTSTGIPGDFQDDGFHEIKSRAIDVTYNEDDDLFCYATQDALYEYDPETGFYEEVTLDFSILANHDIFRIWWRKGTGSNDAFYYVLTAVRENTDQHSSTTSGFYQPIDQKSQQSIAVLWASNRLTYLATFQDIQLAPVVYRPSVHTLESEQWVARFGGERDYYPTDDWELQNENVAIPFSQYLFALSMRRSATGDATYYSNTMIGTSYQIEYRKLEENSTQAGLFSSTTDSSQSWDVPADAAMPDGQYYNENDLRSGRGYYSVRLEDPGGPTTPAGLPNRSGGLRYSMGNGPMVDLDYSTDTWFAVSPRTCWFTWCKWDETTDRWWILNTFVEGVSTRWFDGNTATGDDATYTARVILDDFTVPTFVRSAINGYADRHGAIFFGWHDFYGEVQGSAPHNWIANNAGIGFYPMSGVSNNAKVTFDTNARTPALVHSYSTYSGSGTPLTNRLYQNSDDYAGLWTPVAMGIWQFLSGSTLFFMCLTSHFDRMECQVNKGSRRMGIPYRLQWEMFGYNETSHTVAHATASDCDGWRSALPPMGFTKRLDGDDHLDVANDLFFVSPADDSLSKAGVNLLPTRIDSIPHTAQYMSHGTLAVGAGGGPSDPFVAGVTSPVFPFTGRERWPLGEYKGWLYGSQHTGRVPLLDLSDLTKWDAITKLAEVGHHAYFFDRDGTPLVRPYPEADATPDLELETGDWAAASRTQTPLVNHASRSLADVVGGKVQIQVQLGPFSDWNLAPYVTGFGQWPIDVELKCVQGGLVTDPGPWTGNKDIGATLWAFRSKRKRIHTTLGAAITGITSSITIDQVEQVEVGDYVTLSTEDDDLELTGVNYTTGVCTLGGSVAELYDAGADVWVVKKGDQRWSWERNSSSGANRRGVAQVMTAASVGDNRVHLSSAESVGVGNLICFDTDAESDVPMYLVRKVYHRYSVDESLGDPDEVWIEVEYIDQDGDYDGSGAPGLRETVSAGTEMFCLLTLPPGNRQTPIGGTGLLFAAVGESADAEDDEEEPVVEGDRVTISYPGLVIEKNSHSKVTARDAASIQTYGKRSPRGLKPNRFMPPYLANQDVKRRVRMGLEPRADLTLRQVKKPGARLLKPMDVVRARDYRLLQDRGSGDPTHSVKGVVGKVITDLKTGFPDIRMRELVDTGGATARVMSSDLPEEITRVASMWFKADAITDLEDLDPVETWADQGAYGNDATQATSTKRPLWEERVQNSLPGLKFDGTDDFLDCGDVEFTTSGTVGIDNPGTTIFVVGKIDSSKVSMHALFSKFGASTGMAMFLRELTGYIGDDPTVYDPTCQVSATLTKDAAKCWCLTCDPGSNVELFENNTSIATSTGTTASTWVEGDAATMLGSEAIGFFYLKGYLFEVLAIPRYLSSDDRGTVWNYVRDKWDLT